MEDFDTVDANSVLGFDDDERDYGIAVRMLQMLGCTRVRLMTNNPSKLDGLSRAGIDVSGRVPLHGPINADNRRYLAAKATRAGHQLDHVLGALAEPVRDSEKTIFDFPRRKKRLYLLLLAEHRALLFRQLEKSQRRMIEGGPPRPCGRDAQCIRTLVPDNRGARSVFRGRLAYRLAGGICRGPTMRGGRYADACLWDGGNCPKNNCPRNPGGALIFRNGGPPCGSPRGSPPPCW